MFNSIGIALTAFFSMITSFCHAGEKVAGAADHIAGWGKESAAAFEDEAKHNRALSLEESAFKREQRKKELAAMRAQADAETATVITQAKAKGETKAIAAS